MGGHKVGRPPFLNIVYEANGTFAVNLLRMLCNNNPSKNVCYSPINISSALAMFLLGVKGNTEIQISEAIGLNTAIDIHQSFLWILNILKKPTRKYTFRMANRLFAENTCEFLPTFKEPCLQFYHWEMEHLPFTKAPEEARNHINTWVCKNTKGKIPELLSSGSVDSETRLVLVNALYFKGRWHHQFDIKSTRKMPFKINKDEERPVQMMFQEDMFKLAYVNEVQVQVLVLPYKGKELSLVVLLPDDGVELSKVEGNLTFEKLSAWTKPDYLKTTKVLVFLPKFKLEDYYDMESIFQDLGVGDIFQGGKADLSEMSPERGLCVSKFIQKCVVEVNEEGTEATAATADDTVCSAETHDGQTFCADHPFLFFIRHNKTNSILFCGRFSFP
ncbi:serine (or cysteine) proteinase inhibitor, clade B, member 9c isoform 1 [Mus musculus]|uniref:Leukocyte elastase inhibitor n=1 Tax=Mus musculus TaxID=10090 RepID=I7HJI5_MOUSE|nr:serine (or cysteine) proteinase inhibitor, clade B, member 9c isoform 1 [Mus musculus]|eukprot:NP_001157996.1 serine (or cysteine) proteinase inhibitor, clade B, member 9c isoform 1 [Mus musculus]